MPHLRITITRFIDPHQPGWVACTLTDVYGALHTFHEKIPVVTPEPLDENSTYPQQGVIACRVVSTHVDDAGRTVVTIDTATPWSVESTEGMTQFKVFEGQLTDF